jgi:hypothetical protein
MAAVNKPCQKLRPGLPPREWRPAGDALECAAERERVREAQLERDGLHACVRCCEQLLRAHDPFAEDEATERDAGLFPE